MRDETDDVLGGSCAHLYHRQGLATPRRSQPARERVWGRFYSSHQRLPVLVSRTALGDYAATSPALRRQSGSLRIFALRAASEEASATLARHIEPICVDGSVFTAENKHVVVPSARPVVVVSVRPPYPPVRSVFTCARAGLGLLERDDARSQPAGGSHRRRNAVQGGPSMLSGLQLRAKSLVVCAFEEQEGRARAGLVQAGPDVRLYQNQWKRPSTCIPFPYHATLVVCPRAGRSTVIMSSTWEPT